MIKRSILLLIICALSLASNVSAANTETAFNSDEQFGKWVSYYYLQPEPAKIPAAIKYYADSALFNKVHSRLPMAAFSASLFSGDPALMEKAFDDISANGSYNAKVMLLRILWLVNTKESKGIIDKAAKAWKSGDIDTEIKEILTIAPPDILNSPIKDASQLDMLWSSFFATGDSAPIKRMISVLHLTKDGHGMDIVIGGAAQWSLGSNAFQHKKVYAICKDEIKNTDATTGKILQDIIARVDAGGKK